MSSLRREYQVAGNSDNMRVALKNSNSLKNTYIAAFSAFTYIAVMGFVIGYSSSATEDMKKSGSRFKTITADQISWIVSLPNLTGVLGNFLSGFLSQKLGRKAVLIFVSATYMMSWLMIAYASSITWIYVGRLIAGFSCGMACVAVPAYVVEISTNEIRGFLSSGFQVFYSVGVLIVMSLGIVLRWSWLAVSSAIFVAFGAVLMVIMPESPAWLVHDSKMAEATHALKFLRGEDVDVTREIQDITENMVEHPSGRIKWRDFLQPTLYKPMLIVIFLFLFSQLSGMAALISYTVDIFEKSGSFVDARVAAAIVALVQLVVTIISSMLIDRVGRKFLFITSGVFIFLSLATLGIYSIMLQKYNFDLSHFRWLPLVTIIVYIAAYSLGFGPIPFVITPELVPIHSRSILLAIGTLTCSLTAFVIAKTFDSLRTLLGDYGMYWTYALFSLLGSIFCYIFMQETKCRSIRDINKSFDYKRTA